MSNLAINKGDIVAIIPSDINVDPSKGFTGFWGTFKSCENEAAAAQLVAFAQSRGTWDPFLVVSVDRFWQKEIPSLQFSLARLVEDGYIIDRGGFYHFTYKFVGLAYGSSPNLVPST